MIADFHAAAIGSLENACLVGVADARAENAKSFAEKYSVKAYDSFESMLADGEVDAVCICTPNGYHAENAITALQAKKHVVLEKPMAITVEDTLRVANACEQSGCMLSVVSQLRFSQDVKRVKDLLAENAFGKLVFCNLSMKYWRDPAYYANGVWKGTKALDGGGALMNQGIHGVDLLLYIAGDAKVLSAKTQTAFHDIEVEDVAVAMLAFENGCVGTLEASTCAYPGFERVIEIVGSEGCAVLKENTLTKLVVRGETVVDLENVALAGTASDPAAMSYTLHAKQLDNFIKAVQGKEPLLMNAVEGQRAVKLIQEIYNKG